MRLLICAGGTGGGVNPALAVVQSLLQENEAGTTRAANFPLNLLWVGGIGGMEADLVMREGVPFEAIPAAGVHGVGLRSLPGNLWQLGRGYGAARRLLRRFQPEVVFFTGGYVAGPLALAARLPLGSQPRPHLAVYVPDIEPGLALKALTPFADHIAVTTEESRRYFPKGKPVTVTGYPVRPGMQPVERGEARRSLGLQPDLPVILVSGGSRGARSINRALHAALPHLLPVAQIIHLSGKLDWDEASQARQALPQELASRYHPYAYLHTEMAAALSAADLILTRAGASTLGELPLFGLPAVLVPYPYAWRYQKVNADYLVERGAAELLNDENLQPELTARLLGLLNSPAKLQQMSRRMRSLAQPQAAATLGRLLYQLGGAADQQGRVPWSA